MWNQLKTILYLGALSSLAVAALSWVAPGWWLGFAVVGLAFNLGAYFFSDRVVLRMQGARPLARSEHPELHAMNDIIAERAGIPAPRLYIIDADYANAFATGRGPGHSAVAFTRQLLEQLPPREVAGVLAHEIAHVKNRDVLIATIAACVATMVSAVANMLQFTAIFGGSSEDEEGSGLGGLVFALLAPLGATLVQLAISRAREYVADETAARLTGDPAGLASALERLSHATAHAQALPQPAAASLFIVNPFGSMQTLASLFSTHPPMQERIRRLRALSLAITRRAA